MRRDEGISSIRDAVDQGWFDFALAAVAFIDILRGHTWYRQSFLRVFP